MARPNLLDRELTVEIRPGVVLLNGLREMVKFREYAVLIVTGQNKFQIRTMMTDHGVCEILELESCFIFASSYSDGYCLRFHIRSWLRRLNDRISRQPSCLLSIMKLRGSTDVCCLLGEEQLIELGNAQFVISNVIRIDELACQVRVSMSVQQFKEFITAFASRHNNQSVSRVQMVITASTIRWITAAGYYDHPAEEYEIEGIAPGGSYQFQLRWDWPLLLGFLTMSIGYERFELSVFRYPSGARCYRFRFFWSDLSYSFSNLEIVPYDQLATEN